MKERRCVKLRSDMYDDTKFKIIDMKPERDMIYYVWTRLLTLAAKVNLAGDLFMSRNIPYTIETLAIEFNRSEEQIKIALEVFMELEMIELSENEIYRVKNFAKHQNIKVKEKVEIEEKEDIVKNIEVGPKVVFDNRICDKHKKKLEKDNKDNEFENSVVENKVTDIRNENKKELANDNGINTENNISKEIRHNVYENDIPISLEVNKNKKQDTKKKKEEVIDITDKEEDDDEEIFSFTEGEYVLGEGEEIIASWTFD